MKTLTLTPAALDLLLVLLTVNRDTLSKAITSRFGPRWWGLDISGRVPNDTSDKRAAQELALTCELIRMLEE